MHATHRNSGVMGMDWKTIKQRIPKTPHWLWDILKIVAGVSVIALLVGGFAFLFSHWPDGKTEAKKLKEVIEAYRNLGLLSAGAFALWFAWHRSRIMDKQTAFAAKDDRRKDKERIEERLEGAVRLLAEPTDSMKHFAITQLKQIGIEHPEQALASAVACLCGQAKEYSPYFSESDKNGIRQDASSYVSEKFLREHNEKIESLSKVEVRHLLKEVDKDQLNDEFEKRLTQEKGKRIEDMIRSLIGAVNTLSLKAKEIGHTEDGPAKLPIDLRGVTITRLRIDGITIRQEWFSSCSFIRVEFQNCHFTGNFNHWDHFVDGCQFQNCTFSETDFWGSDFTSAKFFNCTFDNAVWLSGSLCEAEFTDTKIGDTFGTLFDNCEMSGVKFHFEAEKRYKDELAQRPKKFRLNFTQNDFKSCFVMTDLPLPQGLEKNVPQLIPRITREVEDVQHFDVELIEEAPSE